VAGTTEGSFSRAFFRGMMLRIVLAVGAMALSYAGAAIGETNDAAWAPFLGAVAGLLIGIVLVGAFLRRGTGRS
jgi:outer membrane lipoprotein SlyB